jgi:hypothetical protein
VVRGTVTWPSENGVFCVSEPGSNEVLATIRLHEPGAESTGRNTVGGRCEVFHGRLTAPQHEAGLFDPTTTPFTVQLIIDTTASRFHPASVAGLVVGAMGAFIFSLYLRSWLRERKAAA